MKKILSLIIAAAALAACSSSKTYYQGNVRYTQEGTDCIYEMVHDGNFLQRTFDEKKRVVHRETLCSQLIERNMIMTQRPVPQPATAPVEVPTQKTVEAERKPAAEHPNLVYIEKIEIRNESPLDRAIADMRARPARPCAKPVVHKNQFNQYIAICGR